MATLTKEEGGPLSRSASSHPTSVPRINPFHLPLCGDTTSEPPNKGGRKPSPCTGGGRRRQGDSGLRHGAVPHLARWRWPSLSPSHQSLAGQDLLHRVLPAPLAVRADQGIFLPLGRGVCRRIRPREQLHLRSSDVFNTSWPPLCHRIIWHEGLTAPPLLPGAGTC